MIQTVADALNNTAEGLGLDNLLNNYDLGQKLTVIKI